MNPDLPVVSARNLSKQFGSVQAVSNLDLDVPRACIYGFLGPNGSGKSTTIRMLCGLLMPSAGSVSVLNLAVPQDSAKLKSRIGYMTQTFSLFSDLTIRENLDFMARIYGVQGSERRRRVSELEARYDLEARSGQLAGTLSGGQKQRLALACSVVHRPELLLLDEPTSAVDPRSRRDFWACLFELVEAGTTILVSTHYMDEAERCHRLAILDQGKKVADGSPPDLKRQTQVQVVEVQGQEPENLQRLLLSADQVISVTQLGVRLRVLVPVSLSDPEALVTGLINQRAGNNNPGVTTRLVEPSLEDVFVVVTDHVGGATL